MPSVAAGLTLMAEMSKLPAAALWIVRPRAAAGVPIPMAPALFRLKPPPSIAVSQGVCSTPGGTPVILLQASEVIQTGFA